MTRSEAGPPAYVRLARVGAALLTGVAILIWVTPINVRSTSGFFGCGSPADPRGGGDLVDLVCKTDLDAARLTAAMLLLAAGAVLFLSEFVAPRFAQRGGWPIGAIAVSPLALFVIGISAAGLLSTVGGTNPEGAPFRCGTPLQPATDSISTLVCGQLTESRLALGVGGVVLGLGLLAGAAYLTHRQASEGMTSAETINPEVAPEPPKTQPSSGTDEPVEEKA